MKGTRTEPQCGFSHRVLTLLNEARIDYEVGTCRKTFCVYTRGSAVGAVECNLHVSFSV